MRPSPDHQPPDNETFPPLWKGLRLPSVPEEHRGQDREGHATRSWRATLRGLSPAEILRREALGAKVPGGARPAAARQPGTPKLFARLRHSRLALALTLLPLLLVGVALPVAGLQMGAWSAQRVVDQRTPTPGIHTPPMPSSGGAALVPPSPTLTTVPATPTLPATTPPEQGATPPPAATIPPAPTTAPEPGSPPPATDTPQPPAPTATPGNGVTSPPATATPQPPAPTATPQPPAPTDTPSPASATPQPSVPTNTPPAATATSPPAPTATPPAVAPTPLPPAPTGTPSAATPTLLSPVPTATPPPAAPTR
jgi:hypothetical protein